MRDALSIDRKGCAGCDAGQHTRINLLSGRLEHDTGLGHAPCTALAAEPIGTLRQHAIDASRRVLATLAR